MPRGIYSEFVDLLKSNMTIIVPRDSQGLKARDATELCSALGVAALGLLTHSSVDRALLTSKRIQRALLCDPIDFPLARQK